MTAPVPDHPRRIIPGRWQRPSFEPPWLAAATCCAVAIVACGPSHPPPPETRQDPVTDTIHGVTFVDAFRWLEDQDSPETRTWLAEQNNYAETIVGRPPLRDSLERRLRQLMDAPGLILPQRRGEYEYFTYRPSGRELDVIFRRPAQPEGPPVPVDPSVQYEVVVDPHAMTERHTTAVDIASISDDGRYLVYTVRDGGQDEVSIRVRDLERSTDLPDRLPNALYSSITFNRSGSGFYYSRRSRVSGARIRFHELGADPATDRLLFGEGYGPETFVSVNRAGDDWLLFTAQHGWARSEVFLQRVTGGPIIPIITDADARFAPRMHEGTLYLRTNLDAPNNRLVAVDPVRPAQEHWREIIPESDALLDDVTIIDDKLYATYLEDVSNRMAVYTMDGTLERAIPVPDHHSASIRGSDEGHALLTFTSYAAPPTVYRLNLDSLQAEVLYEPDVPFDSAGILVEQVWYTSRDGTRAPMYIMRRRDMPLDSRHPTLLTGYGGFNVSLKPRFDAMGAAWVERGGIFAIATLRGGGEFGESWHRAGMLENKQNVFDDFIAAAEYLIAHDYTNPDRLAIRGGSNGGLLVASAMTQRPDLYRAVLCTFPDLDMVRFHTFGDTNNKPALLEYGDASDPAQFAFLRQYSPYQAIEDGMDYPAVMLTSGDLDTRVPPLQARKMAAVLQAATGSGLPVILHYDDKAGHAGGRPFSERVTDTAMAMTFLLEQLGAID